MAFPIRSKAQAFDFTAAPSLTDGNAVEAEIGNYILVVYSYENRSGANQNQTSPPTWNGQTLAPVTWKVPDDPDELESFQDYVYHDPDDLMTRVSAYECFAESSGTFAVIGAMTYYAGCHVIATVLGGVDAENPRGKLFSISKFGSWVNPALTVKDVASGDVILDFLSSSLYDSDYSNAGSATFSPTQGQTVIGDTVSTASKAGRLKVGYKTGVSGDIAVGYTSSGLHPIYGYLAVAIRSASTISDLATPLRPGIDYGLSVSDLADWASVTFGDVELEFVNGVSVSMPAWANGYVDPLNVGANYTLTITDINGDSATIIRPYAAPATYTHNQMGAGMSVDTGNQSIGKDPAIVAGTEVFPPPLGGGTMNNAGQFVGVPFGTYPGFWLRNLDLEMWEFTVVITEQSVIVVFTANKRLWLGLGLGL